jgi:flagellar basal body-associated protein FliL
MKRIKKRWLALIIGVLTVLAVSACAGVYFLTSDGIDQKTAASIHKGMSENDVVRIFGRPCDRPGSFEQAQRDGHIEKLTTGIWSGRDGHIQVNFLETGLVRDAHFYSRDRWSEFLRKFGLDIR